MGQIDEGFSERNWNRRKCCTGNMSLFSRVFRFPSIVCEPSTQPSRKNPLPDGQYLGNVRWLDAAVAPHNKHQPAGSGSGHPPDRPLRGRALARSTAARPFAAPLAALGTDFPCPTLPQRLQDAARRLKRFARTEHVTLSPGNEVLLRAALIKLGASTTR